MKRKYITVNLRTIKGIEKAEKLKEKGYVIISIGFDTIQLEKKHDVWCNVNLNSKSCNCEAI